MHENSVKDAASSLRTELELCGFLDPKVISPLLDELLRKELARLVLRVQVTMQNRIDESITYKECKEILGI